MKITIPAALMAQGLAASEPRKVTSREDLPSARALLARQAPLATGKAGKRPLICPEVREQIAAGIRAGAFPWVAAGAAGIMPRTYRDWMYRGEREAIAAEDTEREPDEYGLFWLEVTQAKLEARRAVEASVAILNPVAWLTKGPGRERPGEEGWTERAQVELTGKGGGPLALTAVPPPALDVSRLTDDELAQYEALASKCLADRGLALGESREGSA